MGAFMCRADPRLLALRFIEHLLLKGWVVVHFIELFLLPGSTTP